MKISILGSGNTAFVLGKLIRKAGHEVVQVYGRNAASAHELAGLLQAKAVTELAALDPEAALIYLVALPDSVIPQLGQSWQSQKGLVVHTAGAVPLQSLAGASRNYGVLYPLQSLRKESMPLLPFPLLIDANDAEDRTLLFDFAQSITGMARLAGDEERLQFHLAAVFANNFVNHLLVLAADYCQQQHLDFDLLQPLIRETTARLADFSPELVQTGPALRNDQPTLQRHLQLLAGNPPLQELYQWFTNSIRQRHAAHL